MRHRRKSRRFGRNPAHRLSMFNNLVTSLFLHERILTTLDRAKELRRLAERLITLGKRGDLHARRLAAQRLRTTRVKVEDRLVQREEALRKLFETIGPRFKDRPGGYTRIVRTGNRLGDNAKMAFIELLPEETKAAKPSKKKAAGERKPAAGSRAKPKAAKPAAKPARPAKAAKPKTSRASSKKASKKAAADEEAE